MTRWWWKWCNLDILGFVVLIIAVFYFIITGQRKKYPFLSRVKDYSKVKWGDVAFDLSGVSGWLDPNECQGVISQKKKKGKFNKHEERCRDIFQKLFGVPFKSVRPSWLSNPATGHNLELDGYCESIQTPLGRGLAFEYDGAQHSKYNKHFHRNGVKDFQYQLKKDQWKDIMCKKRGVLLIRIPHFVAYDILDDYITKKLRRKGVYVRKYSTNKNDRTNILLNGLYS